MKKAIFTVALVAAFLFGALPASAGGSDSPTPYTVDQFGITLPDGVVFEGGGHVNIQTTAGNRGIHFESLNNQPSGFWIGKSFLPWSAFGEFPETFCVTWVQLSQFNEHYGEGGQPSVCIGGPTPTPTPTGEPTSTPTPEPTVTPTGEPTSTPTPEPTSTLLPTNEPTPQPTSTQWEPREPELALTGTELWEVLRWVPMILVIGAGFLLADILYRAGISSRKASR